MQVLGTIGRVTAMVLIIGIGWCVAPHLFSPSRLANPQGAASQHPSIYFAPQQNVALIDISLIRHSRRSIQIAMYAFTDRRIAKALVDACRQGVDISIYRDHEQYQQEKRHNSPVHQILQQCEGIHVRVKRSRELMHEKAALFDGVTLRDGSGNWSISAVRYQDNEISITQQPEEVEAFKRDFARMWQRSDNIIVHSRGERQDACL